MALSIWIEEGEVKIPRHGTHTYSHKEQSPHASSFSLSAPVESTTQGQSKQWPGRYEACFYNDFQHCNVPSDSWVVSTPRACPGPSTYADVA